MRTWNQIVLGVLLAVPALGQTAPPATVPAVPILQEAAVPVYPPIGRAARITGKVVVAVTVNGDKVTATEVKSGPRLLFGGTVTNLQTWRFASDVNGTFTVTYSYVISGDETDNPTNPRVEMLAGGPGPNVRCQPRKGWRVTPVPAGLPPTTRVPPVPRTWGPGRMRFPRRADAELE